MAGELGSAALALTFDPHPARLLHPEQAPAPLCWTERKAELLGQLGVDAVLAYPTDAGLAAAGARGIFSTASCSAGCTPAGWSRGETSSSDTIAGGTVELLGQFCQDSGVKLEVV